MPAADYFPLATDPVRAEEASHALAMDVCCVCGLAQLADDDTVADEPRGVEPQALKDQAEEAIQRVAAVGLAAWEYRPRIRKPTWWDVDPATRRTWVHHRRRRRRTWCWTVSASCTSPTSGAPSRGAPQVTAPDGVLLLQYHSIVTIVEQGQWNALRHGHFAYYSLTTLMTLLGAVGMRVVTAWEFDLYGGTVLVAAVHGEAEPDESVQRILATEEALGMTNPDAICRLQHSADQHVDSLRNWLEEEAEAGRTVLAYGAASRAVALFSRAGLDSRTYSRRSPTPRPPSKAGGCQAPTSRSCRRMNFSRRRPDRVLLDASRSLARGQCEDSRARRRWKVDGQFTVSAVAVSGGRGFDPARRREWRIAGATGRPSSSPSTEPCSIARR